MSERKTYLGDGLYASFDGDMIGLRAPREREDHVVFLEPEVLLQFLRFAKEKMPNVFTIAETRHI